MLTWLLCANATNTLYINYYCITLFTFDIECVIPVKFSSSTYTVGENERSLTGTLETPAYHARSFTAYVVPYNMNATATSECLAVVYCQSYVSICCSFAYNT